mgnify:CR=1 FL=1
MPFILIFIGVAFMVVAWRDTYTDLLELIKKDFTGENNFLMWFLSLFILGAIGYIRPLREISRALMVLVAVSMILSNRGLFEKLREQI